jgi:hypothetical protein
MTGRYAAYLAPDATSLLARWAPAWLGYDVATGVAVPQLDVGGIPGERLRGITAGPRRYGFHATLKAGDGVGGRGALYTAVTAMYPYVMHEFRFPMTLAGRLDGIERDAVGEALAPLVAPFCRDPLRVDKLCLFRKETEEAPFRLIRRYPLAG